MIGVVDEDAIRQEFERLATLDPLIGVSNAASYGLLLLDRQKDKERQVTDLKAKLQDLLARFIALGGIHWDNLPSLPKPPQPTPPVAPVEP